MSGFKLRRLGFMMEPEAGNPQEIEGVLNPAAARGPDGKLYFFPRLVAKGNYSRIGIARVQFNAAGDPAGVERQSVLLLFNLLGEFQRAASLTQYRARATLRTQVLTRGAIPGRAGRRVVVQVSSRKSASEAL
jgi:hypothetical protein